jgi:HPt (histidine-containing phosphotransfer) domain-containing protein
MTEAGDPAINALIAAARTEYAQSLVAKAASLEALVSRGAWNDARRAAHKLRGSAGVHGFALLGDAAAALEDLLLEVSGTPAATARARIDEKLSAVRAEAERAGREVP